MMNDPLGDMLTRIHNAQMRRRPKVSTPASNLRQRVLDVLVEEGYVRGYTKLEYKSGIKEFEIELKYNNDQPAIRAISRVSSPGRRVYRPDRDLRAISDGDQVSTGTGQRATFRSPRAVQDTRPMVIVDDNSGTGVVLGSVGQFLKGHNKASWPGLANDSKSAGTDASTASEVSKPAPLFAPSQDVAARELDDIFGQWLTANSLRKNQIRK